MPAAAAAVGIAGAGAGAVGAVAQTVNMSASDRGSWYARPEMDQERLPYQTWSDVYHTRRCRPVDISACMDSLWRPFSVVPSAVLMLKVPGQLRCQGPSLEPHPNVQNGRWTLSLDCRNRSKDLVLALLALPWWPCKLRLTWEHTTTVVDC